MVTGWDLTVSSGVGGARIHTLEHGNEVFWPVGLVAIGDQGEGRFFR